MRDCRLLIGACTVWIVAFLTFTDKKISLLAIILLLASFILLWAAKNEVAGKLFASFFIVIILAVFSFSATSFQESQMHSYNPTDKATSSASKTSNNAKESTVVVGKIVSNLSKTTSTSGQIGCSAEIETAWIEQGGIWVKRKVYVKAYSDESFCNERYGISVYATGKASPTKGGATQKEAFNLFNANAEKVANEGWLDRAFNDAKEREVQNVASIPLEQAKGLMQGMAYGDKKNIDSSLLDNSKTSGLAHLIVISGAHFVIIMGMIGTICSLVGLSKAAQVIVQMGSMVLMVLFVHPQDSVMRAAFMGMIGLLGIFAKRPAQSVSALSAAVIVLILLDPYRATSYGFALSCAATMGIVLSAKPIEFRLERLLPETLAALLAVPIAAAVWTSPILVLMTGKFNLLTVPANIIAVPFIEGATIFGLLSTVLSFCAVVSVPLAWVGTLFAQGIVFDANAIASLPLASVYWIQGVVGALILVGIFLALAFSGRVYRFVYTKVRGYEPSEADTLVYRLRRKTGSVFAGVGGLFKVTPIVLACCIVIALAPPATLLTVNSLENGKPPADWVIAACKVGQGDANLIHTSAHSAIVVDVGPSPENMGKCIKEFGIEKIDLLVLTHFHSDHVDGLSEVAGKVPIAQAFVSKVQPNTKEVKTTLSLLKSNNIPTSTPKEGESGTIDGDVDSVKWEVVSALGAPSGVKLSGLSAAKLDDAENDSSVSLFVKITPRLGGTGAGSEGSAGAGNAPGAQSAGSAGEAEGAPNAGAAEPANHEITGLFLGDLELEGQQNLLKAVKREHISDVDVLKVAHHGSKTQNKVLAEIVHPRVAIYDVGHNTFGHPNKQTVSMFEQMGALSLKTLDSSVGVYIDKNGELEGFR